MGVEYLHFLVVDDAAWLPEPDSASRIHEVLRGARLVADDPDVFDLRGNRKRPIDGALHAPMGPGLLLAYPGIDGPAIAQVAGPSHYPEVDDDERYIQEISLIVGSDYRVHLSNEAFYFKVLKPPTMASGAPIEPYLNDPPVHLFDAAYPTLPGSVPPQIRIDIKPTEKKHVSWSQFSGFWRAALVFDFGKDLPAFTDQLHALPNRTFVSAVSEALRAPIIEVGEFY